MRHNLFVTFVFKNTFKKGQKKHVIKEPNILKFVTKDMQSTEITLLFIQINPEPVIPDDKDEPGQERLRGGGGDGGRGHRDQGRGPPADTEHNQSRVNLMLNTTSVCVVCILLIYHTLHGWDCIHIYFVFQCLSQKTNANNRTVLSVSLLNVLYMKFLHSIITCKLD